MLLWLLRWIEAAVLLTVCIVVVMVESEDT